MHDEIVELLRLFFRDMDGARDFQYGEAGLVIAEKYASKIAALKAPPEEGRAVELLRRIRQGHMIQPSMLARNWEAYELLREVDALLGNETLPQRSE